jgi:hypothetical protein
MTCAEFDAALPDYMEGVLADSSRPAVEAHLRQCLRCAALVRDIETIRKEAAALPDLAPARDLWSGIDARIAAPVIRLAARPQPKRRVMPVWMGIAAAALVVSTAGITYQLTSRSIRSGPDARAARTAPAQVAAESVNATEPSGGSRPTQAAPSPAASPARMASFSQPSPVAQSERVYGKEIAMLQQIVSQRKTQLDSATIAIIDQNLEIIDAAIARSRAALARDPASRLLSDQLNHVLDKKVELLRTAAMLPAST